MAFLDEIMDSLGLLPKVSKPTIRTGVERELYPEEEALQPDLSPIGPAPRREYAPILGRTLEEGRPITPDMILAGKAIGEGAKQLWIEQARAAAPPAAWTGRAGGPTIAVPKGKGKDITKASPERKVIEKIKTPVEQEDPLGPLPYTGPVTLAKGKKAEEKPDFWTTLLQNMFIPGKSPTGIPWIFPFLMSGFKGGDIWVRAWMGLREQKAKKEQARTTAKRAAYNQVMTNLRSGVIDDLTPEQRKYYADVDPTLMEKRKYTKYQRYFWDKAKKKWIKEDEAMTQGMDVSAMPMSGQEVEYVDWSVRAKTPLAKAEQKEQISRTMRAKNLSMMKRKIRDKGYDPNSPEVQARLSEYVRTGVWPEAQWIETEGALVYFDPVIGVVGRRIKIGMSPEDRAAFELKNRIKLEEELIKYRAEAGKLDPTKGVELQTELEQRISGTYDRMIRAEIMNLNRLRQLATDPMAMQAQGVELSQVEAQVKASQEKLGWLKEEMLSRLGALYALLEKQGHTGLLKIDVGARRTLSKIDKGLKEQGEAASRFSEVQAGKTAEKKKTEKKKKKVERLKRTSREESIASPGLAVARDFPNI